MTIRERIADWISGGALTQARLSKALAKFMHRLELDRSAEQKDRLSRIAALETPSANATVRKMARIARGEG